MEKKATFGAGCFWFFQAEDGIRDVAVTGVQTCALPISYGHDPGGMRFSRLSQIDRANVQKLQRIWTYHTGETNWSSFSGPQHIQAFETTPLMVDGVVYFTTPASRAIALDAETGKEIWIFDPFSGASGKRGTLQNRGVSYWEGNSPVACGGEGGKLDKRIFFVALDGRLFTMDPLSGKPCKGFGQRVQREEATIESDEENAFVQLAP